jgi:hypothetical protein
MGSYELITISIQNPRQPWVEKTGLPLNQVHSADYAVDCVSGNDLQGATGICNADTTPLQRF